ncbi:flagellar basal body rod protein FlgC [uncultured Sphingomonas sp.]|uniref:flagellar basal body rod protein FlgC n=1 Tax=uncultured Sphingomonas sp. TaxID=158754 RepID=UPI0025D27536|nr:flagellar basal body rod protein FlgC [uncultured Sphingomonas sp.]
MRASEISRTGLDVEWQRLQVIAENLANVSTSRTVSGQPYRPMRLLSGPAAADFRGSLGTNVAHGVAVMGLEPVAGGTRRVHEPGHPHADAQGFVTYPEVDQAAEMALMIRTSRAYEANLTAMGIAQQMYARALDLGAKS